MIQSVKSVFDRVPFAVMTVAAVSLMILSLYSMAAVSVVEHVKGRVKVKSKNIMQGALKGAPREVSYAYERTD